ncbi:MAG TPA: hypothetical protein VEB66_11840 [Opitutaceae bacterium]|nr:hypothetical protein [Opitutaceae bacterium]
MSTPAVSPEATAVSATQAYQQLLSSALNSGRAQDLPALLRLVTGDHTLPYNSRLRLLHAVCSVAASAAEPLGSFGDVPARRALLVFQPWFNFDFLRMVRTALDDGLLLPVFAGFRTTGRRLPAGVTAENFQAFEYEGYRLWDICAYRLATSLRCLPEDIDARQAVALARIRQVYGEAAELIDEARQFVRFYRPESVIYAQGHDLIAAVVRHVAIRAGIRTVALENVFHREKLGWEDIAGVAVNTNLARNFYWRYRDLIPAAEADRTVERYFAQVDSHKLTEHVSRNARTLPPSPGKTVLYLGQVATDAAVLFGRRGEFRSQVDAMLAAGRAADRLGARLVIKLHPKESPHNPSTEPYFRELTAQWLAAAPEFVRLRETLGERLIVDADNGLHTYMLIRAADLCVTMNSQAGLEAAALGREVILCGDAFYGNLGFTHEAHVPAELEDLIESVLSGSARVNADARSRIFFHTFTELCCLPKQEATLLQLARGRPNPPCLT